MSALLAEAGAVAAAFLTFDSFEISDALSQGGAWIVGLFATVIGATLTVFIYRLVPFIERHLERSVMVYAYLLIAGIIFVEVFRRFLLNEQAPWSTTLPPFLFLIMTWFGCAYNVKLRTHLAFSEFRTSLPRTGQMFCLTVDAILWMGFCWVVVVTSTRITANSASNFQILLGTDDVLQWWFLITIPIAFILMAGRALENWLQDWNNYKSGTPIIERAVIGGDA